jgi:hypothetical protein
VSVSRRRRAATPAVLQRRDAAIGTRSRPSGFGGVRLRSEDLPASALDVGGWNGDVVACIDMAGRCDARCYGWIVSGAGRRLSAGRFVTESPGQVLWAFGFAGLGVLKEIDLLPRREGDLPQGVAAHGRDALLTMERLTQPVATDSACFRHFCAQPICR